MSLDHSFAIYTHMHLKYSRPYLARSTWLPFLSRGTRPITAPPFRKVSRNHKRKKPPTSAPFNIFIPSLPSPFVFLLIIASSQSSRNGPSTDTMATPQTITNTPNRQTQTHPAFRCLPSSSVLMAVSLQVQLQGLPNVLLDIHLTQLKLGCKRMLRSPDLGNV